MMGLGNRKLVMGMDDWTILQVGVWFLEVAFYHELRMEIWVWIFCACVVLFGIGKQRGRRLRWN